mmetsp:Transcript_28347/g.73500  ORF Transcript_28347/g.73500 Transcript_28347/m.73500 type:complete len:205 (+) Transcript_28347:1050-1664(+)
MQLVDVQRLAGVLMEQHLPAVRSRRHARRMVHDPSKVLHPPRAHGRLRLQGVRRAEPNLEARAGQQLTPVGDHRPAPARLQELGVPWRLGHAILQRHRVLQPIHCAAKGADKAAVLALHLVSAEANQVRSNLQLKHLFGFHEDIGAALGYLSPLLHFVPSLHEDEHDCHACGCRGIMVPRGYLLCVNLWKAPITGAERIWDDGH